MKIISLIFLFYSNVVLFGQNKFAVNSHSHNDYNNTIPLYNALKAGAKSIEVDIFFENNKFYVCHNNEDTIKNKSLEKMYFLPLQEIIENNKSLHHFEYELFLFIDIKSEAEKTYQPLKILLSKYVKYLTKIQNGNLIKNKLRVILSGNMPIEMVRNEIERFIFLDGRISNIGKNESNLLFPVISDNWLNVLKIINDSDEEIKFQNLRNLIAQIHSENKMVRFWGIPDNQEYWKLQNDFGVDLINTDRVDNYQKYYVKYFEDKKSNE
ncbi:MAG: hypothetical protein IPM32_12600 [Ignavibacteriae bacterium]|nr:hypothetical protein [Ignavibacteriota bacterium]